MVALGRNVADFFLSSLFLFGRTPFQSNPLFQLLLNDPLLFFRPKNGCTSFRSPNYPILPTVLMRRVLAKNRKAFYSLPILTDLVDHESSICACECTKSSNSGKPRKDEEVVYFLINNRPLLAPRLFCVNHLYLKS